MKKIIFKRQAKRLWQLNNIQDDIDSGEVTMVNILTKKVDRVKDEVVYTLYNNCRVERRCDIIYVYSKSKPIAIKCKVLGVDGTSFQFPFFKPHLELALQKINSIKLLKIESVPVERKYAIIWSDRVDDFIISTKPFFDFEKCFEQFHKDWKEYLKYVPGIDK